MGDDLMAFSQNIRDDGWVAFGNGGINRDSRMYPGLRKGVEQAVEAYPCAIFARCVMAIVGIRRAASAAVAS